MAGGKKTIFRLNRDVRLSNDKSTYNTNLGSVLTRSEAKSEGNGVVPPHTDSSACIAAAGYESLSPNALGPIRDAMLLFAYVLETK